MSDISVAEILKIHGKWIEADKFAELISKKKKVTKRQAYNLINKASQKGEIKKQIFPDRTVIYGLAEFGFPSKKEKKNIAKTLSFEDAFLYDCFKKLDEISEMAVHGEIGIPEPVKALSELRFLIARLPKPLKDKIKPIEKRELETIKLACKLSKDYEDYENACYHAVRNLMDELSTLLHETIKQKS